MDMGIKDKVALVLAASKGLGRACAEDLAREGCRIAICSRTKAEVEQTAGEIAAINPGAAVVDTPVATIGIRGTSMLFRLTPDGGLTVTLRQDRDGSTGEVEITGALDTWVLSAIGEVLSQGAPDQEAVVARLDEGAIFSTFGGNLGRAIMQAAQGAQARFIEDQVEETVPEAGAEGDTGSMSEDRLTAEFQESVDEYREIPKRLGARGVLTVPPDATRLLTWQRRLGTR